MLAIKTVFGDIHNIDRNVNEQLNIIETNPETDEVVDIQMKPNIDSTGRIAVMIIYNTKK